ncbi:undecaprenyldiphospho-muramoylpentapeptide beta-N-acetylglucosaminyltransferase [Ornithinimicrobium ciconiae]|uniref:UDP-N-acetylglucosamine--N-acetylmuramyl-(pentapeptide) pyrophosphoryl-undecaprenol N-acetylglucosamine transferase n=1 Tax=Ornithinimicrobium ciconiae TaxID=2594265 RepID=A0A516G9V4_9MICO|nr:undecaprenyldiphospho-muramoylpentapeptide beta-N-acetylglucosaminyltransferase [Ornithinimicrobium ciconiae]QDO88309.1 undecaprenyldiphospho-muramoylpentapeptide beta-N-acetylglucosaminyltransferase [Ornithinimicrobium ciconiae]
MNNSTDPLSESAQHPPTATGPASLSVVLAGGGSAGHVNPLLATADVLRALVPDVRITVLGTEEGLEARLVPERGYDLRFLPKVPFPRRPNAAALKFPGSMRAAITTATDVLREVGADVVVGFGGYVATPAYLAARRTKTPLVIHEGNARPGLANRLGARFTEHVATTFASTPLRGAEVIGLPMRAEITDLDRGALRGEALEHFGLRGDRTTLLVFGGSLGAQRLNDSFPAAAPDLRAAGVQVLHLTGAGKPVHVEPDEQCPYVARDYTDRMDLAYAVAELAVGRAGAGTVCELTAVGVPAIYVPLPIGNGEQRLNAQDVVAAGGGILVDDGDVTPQWVRESVLPLLADRDRLALMADEAAVMGNRDAAEVLATMVLAAAGHDAGAAGGAPTGSPTA